MSETLPLIFGSVKEASSFGPLAPISFRAERRATVCLLGVGGGFAEKARVEARLALSTSGAPSAPWQRRQRLQASSTVSPTPLPSFRAGLQSEQTWKVKLMPPSRPESRSA